MVLFCTCMGYALFMLYVVCSFGHIGGLHNRYVNSRVASTLYLPKWDLYTASPQTLVSRLYKVEGDKIMQVDVRPFVPTYLFGLDRRTKVLAQEVSVISGDTALLNTMRHYDVVMEETGDMKTVLRSDTLMFTTVARKEITLLNGKYLIAMNDPADWSRCRTDRHTAMPMRVVAVNIIAP